MVSDSENIYLTLVQLQLLRTNTTKKTYRDSHKDIVMSLAWEPRS